jgi:hypothetical protein
MGMYLGLDIFGTLDQLFRIYVGYKRLFADIFGAYKRAMAYKWRINGVYNGAMAYKWRI